MTVPTKRILCLEDHADICDLLFFMLGDAGYELILAKTPANALRLALSEHFDCFILDVRLPGKSGIDLCREIRRIDPSTPVMFYTSDACQADQVAGLKAGAQCYLVKPDDTDHLIETIKRLTGEAETNPQTRNQGDTRDQIRGRQLFAILAKAFDEGLEQGGTQEAMRRLKEKFDEIGMQNEPGGSTDHLASGAEERSNIRV